MVGTLWAQGIHMAAQAYTLKIDPKDLLRGQERIFQAIALHTAMYWAQGAHQGPNTPDPTVAWIKQAQSLRNYHFNHPFEDIPPTLLWPTDP